MNLLGYVIEAGDEFEEKYLLTHDYLPTAKLRRMRLQGETTPSDLEQEAQFYYEQQKQYIANYILENGNYDEYVYYCKHNDVHPIKKECEQGYYVCDLACEDWEKCTRRLT